MARERKTLLDRGFDAYSTASRHRAIKEATVEAAIATQQERLRAKEEEAEIQQQLALIDSAHDKFSDITDYADRFMQTISFVLNAKHNNETRIENKLISMVQEFQPSQDPKAIVSVLKNILIITSDTSLFMDSGEVVKYVKKKIKEYQHYVKFISGEDKAAAESLSAEIDQNFKAISKKKTIRVLILIGIIIVLFLVAMIASNNA